MKHSEIIAEVNERCPNAFSEETKGKSLCTLESRLIYEFTGKEQDVKYPDNFNDELILPNRYADVYILFVTSMCHFWNKEYEEYNNYVEAFNDLLEEYRKERGSTQKSKQYVFRNLF